MSRVAVHTIQTKPVIDASAMQSRMIAAMLIPLSLYPKCSLFMLCSWEPVNGGKARGDLWAGCDHTHRNRFRKQHQRSSAMGGALPLAGLAEPGAAPRQERKLGPRQKLAVQRVGPNSYNDPLQTIKQRSTPANVQVVKASRSPRATTH